MNPVIDPLDYLFTRPPGSATLGLTEMGTTFLCREDREGMRAYPMPCPMAIRLHAWEIEGVVAAAFLARLADRDKGTWETWLNAHDVHGRRLVESLIIQPTIAVLLYVTPAKPARSIQMPNLLKQSAANLLERADQLGPWPMSSFDAAKRTVESRHPSVAALWGEGERQSR